MATVEQQKLLNQLELFLKEATSEEQSLVSDIITGLEAKRNGSFRTYIAALTQMEGCFLDNGDYEVRLPIQPLIENPLKMTHGGITATLLDTTMGSLVNRSLPVSQAAVTSEMNIHYIKPGIGQFLRCVASLSHKGNNLCITEAKVFNDQEKLIAMATATFFIIARPTE
ncbi:PaaI family thioesterase [Alkalihalobacillus sp. MEB130]|uniref:PaaI family thioesterase n=1 Tax=Alkalihalobacillus sp. MEB130 TaxID=2976704 RepID=UPI0028E04917|nr:PaaI family thioesterase [Alkalihalobacillus sp. MEB130]MDT8859154.1 PaaI family thioesterase [Alkalihalobacillus sp. MEB130]